MYNGGIMYYILKEHNRILLKGYEYVLHLSHRTGGGDSSVVRVPDL